MATQKAMGKGQLIDRLSAQVGSRSLAVSILKKRGHLKEDGKTLTESGKKRNAMTAEERAKDRASKATGKPASSFSYNASTNRTKSLNRAKKK
jgi:hypothetical protein